MAMDLCDAEWTFNGEDDDMLDAALRFLDEEVTSVQPPSATVSVNASTPLTFHLQFNAEPAVEPKKCTRNWHQGKRPKEQIEELREEAEELERIVKRLRSRRDVEDTVSDMWGAMVSRQLLQRHRAEVENEHLRSSIKEQTDLAQRLEKMIAEREIRGSRTLQLSRRPVVSRLPSSKAREGISELSDILASVTTSLSPMYEQTEWVLTNPDLKNIPVASDGCRVTTKAFPGIDGPAVHLLDSRIVPFDMATTTAAVWGSLVSRMGSSVHDSSAKMFQTRENLLVQLPSFDGVIRSITALRRFDDCDRVVIVRSAVFTYLDDNECIVLTGLAVRHFLWTIVQKPRLPGPDVPSVSQIQTLGVSIPAFSTVFEANSDAITKFLGVLSLQFCESAREDVDDRMLQSKRAGSPSVAMLMSIDDEV